jgi:hypothetical protein
MIEIRRADVISSRLCNPLDHKAKEIRYGS